MGIFAFGTRNKRGGNKKKRKCEYIYKNGVFSHYIFLSSGYLMALQGLALSSLPTEFRARTCKDCIAWSWTWTMTWHSWSVDSMTSIAKGNEVLITVSSNSLGSDQGTRYFFQQLHDFPRWMKCLPFLMAFLSKQTFPFRSVPLFQFYWDLVLALPKPHLELSEAIALSTTLFPGKLHMGYEGIFQAYERVDEMCSWGRVKFDLLFMEVLEYLSCQREK